MSKVQLRGGHSPKWANDVQASTTTKTLTGPILDLADVLSWAIRLDLAAGIPYGGVDPTGAGSMRLRWYLDPRGIKQCWLDMLTDLAGKGLDESGGVFTVGPARGPYLQVLVDTPRLLSGTATVHVIVDGMHQIIDHAIWRLEKVGTYAAFDL